MSEPLGKLVTPTGYNPSGVLRALELDASDNLKVAVMNLVTPAGASFPATPASGDLFYRTDISMLCFYDGTRWLTVQEYSDVYGNTTIAATGNFVRHKLRGDYAPYFTRVAIATVVVAPNDGARYWTVAVQGENLDLTAASDVYSFTTAADAAATAVDHEANASTPTPANKSALTIKGTTTGAPGSLTVRATVFWRLVIT